MGDQVKTINFQIENYRAINKGYLKGSFVLNLIDPGIKFYHCTYFCKEDNRWFILPQEKRTNKETGKDTYFNLIQFTNIEFKEILFNNILLHLKKYEEINEQKDNDKIQSNTPPLW